MAKKSKKGKPPSWSGQRQGPRRRLVGAERTEVRRKVADALGRGATIQSIMLKHGLGFSLFQALCQEAGVSPRQVPPGGVRSKKRADQAKLIKDVKAGVSLPTLCERYHLSVGSIVDLCKAHGAPTPAEIARTAKVKADAKVDQQVSEALQAGEELIDICRKYKVTDERVTRACLDAGLPTPCEIAKRRKLEHRFEMIEMVRRGASLGDVANAYGVQPSTVYQRCRQYGIQIAHGVGHSTNDGLCRHMRILFQLLNTDKSASKIGEEEDLSRERVRQIADAARGAGFELPLRTAARKVESAPTARKLATAATDR